MRIGILGGTFDPIHCGHLGIARAAKEQFALDKVYFVPAPVPPHKDKNAVIASANDRLEMTRLAVAGEAGFEVSEIEFQREGPSYMVDTLENFHEQHPQAELFLIMGSDSLPQIPTWNNPERIKTLAEFLVAPRPGFNSSMTENERVHEIDMRGLSITATDIRKNAFRDHNKIKPMLTDSVMKFIRERKLYADKA